MCLWHSNKGLVKQAYPHTSMKIWHATAGSCIHNILSQSTVMYGFNPIHKLDQVSKSPLNTEQGGPVLFNVTKCITCMFILYTFELH